MLDGHPLFHLAEVVGSERRAGRRYGNAVPWAIGGDPPPDATEVDLLAPGRPLASPLVLSALPSAVAQETEPALARQGHVVCTNASAHRMRADTPLIVPEVNAEAISGIAGQPWSRAGGALVANPNCVVVGLAMALAPIEQAFGIESATVVTLQALSGAGLSGLNAVEVAGNVIPGIRGEEEKIGPELNKILGADIEVAVAVNRVPVLDGHTAHVFCRLRSPANQVDAARVLRDFRSPLEPGSLPTLPRGRSWCAEPYRPQPAWTRNARGGHGRHRRADTSGPPRRPRAGGGRAQRDPGRRRGMPANAELCVAHLGAELLQRVNDPTDERYVMQTLPNVNYASHISGWICPPFPAFFGRQPRSCRRVRSSRPGIPAAPRATSAHLATPSDRAHLTAARVRQPRSPQALAAMLAARARQPRRHASPPTLTRRTFCTATVPAPLTRSPGRNRTGDANRSLRTLRHRPQRGDGVECHRRRRPGPAVRHFDSRISRGRSASAWASSSL